jgi:hypothetical protein
MEFGQQLGEVRWSDEAADRWQWLYGTLAVRPRFGLLGALAARAEAQITRLALIYALLDCSPAIEPEHLEAAEALWNYCEHSLAYVFGPSTGNRHADALRDQLADGPVEWGAARTALGLRSAADMKEVVEVLVSLNLGEVVTLPRDRGGRPRRVIRLLGDEANHANRTQVKQDQTMQTMQKTQHAGNGEGA